MNETYGMKITADTSDIEKKLTSLQNKFNKTKEAGEKLKKSVSQRIKAGEIKITGIGNQWEDEMKKNEARYEAWRKKQSGPLQPSNVISFNQGDDGAINNKKKEMDDLGNTAKKTQNIFRQLGNSIKNAFSGLRIAPEVDNSAIIKIAELRRQIAEMKKEFQNMAPGTKKFEQYAQSIAEAEQNLKGLVDQQKKAKQTTNDLDNSAQKSSSGIANSFSKARKNIIRFALSLFSIRSIFSLVGRASSAYLAQDTELAGKLQSAWAGLGAFLAPLIEWIANKIIKLVKYMNVFIKAVTGQDLLAKASKKATDRIKAQTKATKQLNKSLSDMDEITNIQKDENTGTGGKEGENPFDNFNDVELNPKIVKFLEDLGTKIRNLWDNYLKPFVDWVIKNWKWVALVVVGAFILKTILKIKKAGNLGEYDAAVLSLNME